jgi:integrase
MTIDEALGNDAKPQKRRINAEPRTGKFPKTDLRHWEARIHKPTRNRNERKDHAYNWAAFFQYRGRRMCLSLGTPNKAAAAAKARDIYLSLVAGGWERTLEICRPEMEKRSDLTVGEFLERVKQSADIDVVTLENYAKSLRRIVADSMGIESDNTRFDYRTGGHAEWLGKVHAVKLAKLTPEKIQKWKKGFLEKAKRDPVSQRRARVSVNSFLRQARSLFSEKKVLSHLGGIELPDPLPFARINFEQEPDKRYKKTFNVRALIQKASAELSGSEPEQFKIFLLAVGCGLRRKEIDLLEWDAFRWKEKVIRVEATEHHELKTEGSAADVAIESEVLKIFRGFRARATGSFVIESERPAKAVSYQYYRCQKHFDGLIAWLERHGVKAHKPLHTLRKEFGSEICMRHGIYAASRLLRHADIGTTSGYYVDSRARITASIGRLLKGARTSTDGKIIPIKSRARDAA